MNAEILCVGTELLLGDILNTNAQYLSKELSSLGINVFHQTVVGDNADRLSDCLDVALSRCDLVITTGGLGPTYDDLTKETVAKKFGREMEKNEEALERMQAFFARSGRQMTENNKKQADMPKGATIFQNDWGTAPALALTDGKKCVVMLPGPPREMAPIFEHCVKPFLAPYIDGIIVSTELRLYGVGEAAVEERLRDMMTHLQNPTVAPYAKTGEVVLRVTAKAESEEKAREMLKAPIKEIMDIYGDYIYGMDVDSMWKAAYLALKEKGLKVASAESCTGGGFGKNLTSIPGASAVYDCGIISYSNEMKHKILGVSEEILTQYGAVSEECAKAMAEGVRKLSGADIGVSLTGIAGPDGGTPEKPVGTVFVGCSTEKKCICRKLTLGRGRDERELVREQSLLAAFDLVRRTAQGFEKKD